MISIRSLSVNKMPNEWKRNILIPIYKNKRGYSKLYKLSWN